MQDLARPGAATLARVYWVGGAPDSGKTTVAAELARRYGTVRYEYDRADLRHHRRLAADLPAYRAFLDATAEERWLGPAPRDLADRALASFTDRFPLVLDDLAVAEWVPGRPVIAEGFGLTPALVAPLLASPQQAVWLVPTAEFRAASWDRRAKPASARETSDPARAAANLLARDRLLDDEVRRQAAGRGFAVLEIDGSLTPGEVADRVQAHFAAHLAPPPGGAVTPDAG